MAGISAGLSQSNQVAELDIDQAQGASLSGASAPEPGADAAFLEARARGLSLGDYKLRNPLEGLAAEPTVRVPFMGEVESWRVVATVWDPRQVADVVSRAGRIPLPTVGFYVDFTLVHPGLSGGGGSWGVNSQLLLTDPKDPLFWRYGPTGKASLGLQIGISLQFNIGLGYGSWRGPFDGCAGGLGLLSAGGYRSANWDGWNSGPGYRGLSVGVGPGLGRGGAACTQTDYQPLFP